MLRFLLLSLLFSQVASAAPYAYLDATPSNTTLNGTPLVAGTNYVNDGTSGSGSDNKWSYRTDAPGFVPYQNGTAFESDNRSIAGDAETTDPLVTTITFSTIGTYEIVAVFATNNSRDLAARIGSAPTAGDLFTASNALNANQTLVPLQIEFDGSFSNARGSGVGAVYLGQITTTTPNQAVQIYLNGFASTAASDDERTQYEGIGFRPYVPPAPPVPKHRDVFLLTGQSNADGRGLKAELTGPLAAYAGQQPGVLIHYTNTVYTNADKSRYRQWMTLEPGYSVAPGYTGVLPSPTFGHEISAAKVLQTHYPNPAFIKVTRGGTQLGVPGVEWYPAPLNSPDAGPLYKALIESTQLALAELTAAGDTYTVHALFWHQGESDLGRTAEYGGLLTTLIESVRRDLGMPNLRFIVGELAETKAQNFRDVQWNISRTMPNAGFLSSRGLVTFADATHFTTASMVTFGEQLGHALLPNRSLLNFDAPAYAVGALNRQDEFAANEGLTSALQVVATAAQGEYAAGQAAGHKGASGAYLFSRRHLLPLATARSLQADFFPGDNGYDNQADADSSLLVGGWGADTNADGLFTEPETAIGMGLDATGTFRVQIGATSHLATPFTYQTDRWYRLTLNWSEPDAGGQRTVNLFARDLSTGTNLNSSAPILSLNVASADFDGNPARWLGLGGRATRGLIDHIQAAPPGLNSWATTLYPALTGGLVGDDDQDGISNLSELAFGLDPLRPDSHASLPQLVMSPGGGTVSFPPLASQPGILYQVEWSRDLSSWTAVTGTLNGTLLTFSVPSVGEEPLFIRLRVEVTE